MGKYLSALTSVKTNKRNFTDGFWFSHSFRITPNKNKKLSYIVILLILIVRREDYAGYNH